MEDASEERFDEIQIKTSVLRFVGNIEVFVCFGIFHFRKQKNCEVATYDHILQGPLEKLIKFFSRSPTRYYVRRTDTRRSVFLLLVTPCLVSVTIPGRQHSKSG